VIDSLFVVKVPGGTANETLCICVSPSAKAWGEGLTQLFSNYFGWLFWDGVEVQSVGYPVCNELRPQI